MQKIQVLFIASLFLLALSSCGNAGTTKEENDGEMKFRESVGSIFNTNYRIVYEHTRSLDEEIRQELARLDYSLNPFKENSIISRVNRNEDVEVDSFFVAVFNKAMKVSEKTNGVFDITIAPLINLWGFGFQDMGLPTDRMIDSIKQFVGHEKVTLVENRVVKTDPRVILNMSAIAKGYAVDVIARLLKRHGIVNFMCEIGGEITMRGVNPRGKCWTIGIEKPLYDRSGLQSEIKAILRICDKSVATSGDYRKFHIKNGRKYSHTIDPRTGRPVKREILGVTVIAENCITADVYATVFKVLGKDAALQLANQLPDIYAYFILQRYEGGKMEIAYSEGFERFFVD